MTSGRLRGGDNLRAHTVMLQKIPFLNASEFKRNVAIVFSGSVASQFISIATAPIIARLYAPEQYGIFGVFLSIAAIAAVLPTLRYTQGVIIEKQDSEAARLLQFCALSTFAISVVLALFLAGFGNWFASSVGAEGLGGWLYFLPIVTFLTGITELLGTWLMRFKAFGTVTKSRIIASLSTVISYLIWAYLFEASFHGLVVGMTVAQLISTAYLYFAGRAVAPFAFEFDWEATKPILARHKKFVIYSFPSDLITIFTHQLPVFLLNRFAGSAEVGYFNMSQRILAIPSIFISGSVGEVFKQRATEDFHKTGTCRPIFMKTFKALALLGIVPFLLIFLFGPWMFSVFLGSQWEQAGVYSRIFALMFYLRFVNSPLSYIVYIVNKQQFDILGVLAFNLVTVTVFWIGFMFFSTTVVLIMYVGAFSIVYLVMFLLNYQFSSHIRVINHSLGKGWE